MSRCAVRADQLIDRLLPTTRNQLLGFLSLLIFTGSLIAYAVLNEQLFPPYSVNRQALSTLDYQLDPASLRVTRHGAALMPLSTLHLNVDLAEIERVGNVRVLSMQGWAVDSAASVPVQVVAFESSHPVALAKAEFVRPDVKAAMDSRIDICGFEMTCRIKKVPPHIYMAIISGDHALALPVSPQTEESDK